MQNKKAKADHSVPQSRGVETQASRSRPRNHPTMHAMKTVPRGTMKCQHTLSMMKAKNMPTSYTVQFELPVDNPVNKVRTTCGKDTKTFFVPINYPDIHTLTYSQLVLAAERSGLLDLSTPLNKTGSVQKGAIIK